MSQCSGNAIDHEVELHYYTGIRNFGDELSPYLISKITGRKVSLASSEEGLYAIGSILTHKALWSSCVVWGTGTLCHDSLSGETLRVFPLNRSIPKLIKRLMEALQKPSLILCPENFCLLHKLNFLCKRLFRVLLKSFLISPETTKADIRAVRGPLTREAILKEGGKCPEIYGDPAIIMPRLYTPKIGAKHKAGLILHHTQETPTTHVLAKTCGFHQISIDRVRDEQLENFIDEVCSCQKIFSSSLHGIILAQAYGIPAQWIQITNTPIHRDANHKFADYFLGAGLPVQKPISIELTKESLSQLMQISPERLHISSDLIERLLEAFPFDIFPKK